MRRLQRPVQPGNHRYCYPLTITDYRSRYLLTCEGLESTREAGAFPVFEHAFKAFAWKDYRAKERYRHKTMTLAPDEFMRRSLLHVLPSGFHRIRHYGLIANTTRKDNLARARELLMEQ